MSTRKRTLIFVACAGMALMLPFADAAAAKTKDGCKAITTEDVNTAFADITGGEAPEGTPSEFEGYTSCTWSFPNGETVFIGVDKVSKEAKASFKERRSAPSAEKVKGLKKSFYEPVESGGSGGTVTFIDGTTFVNLQYFTTGSVADPAAVKDALSTLAKKAAKKF